MKKYLMLVIGVLFLFPVSAFAGSATFSTPGTNTFMVPPYTGTLNVSIMGGGGGGGAGGIMQYYWCGACGGGVIQEFYGTNGSGAGTTYINGNSSYITATGGGGGGYGRWDGSYAPAGGAGSGNVSTGGGMPGGAGGPYAYWGDGPTFVGYNYYGARSYLGGARGPGRLIVGKLHNNTGPYGFSF